MTLYNARREKMGMSLLNSGIIEKMLLALQANIEYLKEMGSSQVRVRNGQLTQTIADKYVYRFDLEFLQNIESDAEIEVRIGGKTTSGKVSALNEGSIEIEVDKNLGDKVSEAILIVSSYYLLELLQKKLEAILSGELKVSKIAEQVFSDTNTETKALASYSPPASKIPFNTYQLDALRLALGNPVSFIWGPPGTGKTQTIASIIQGFLADNKSVLLLSHTNKATDEALLKTVEHLGKSNEDYQDGKIIRFGDITLPELKERYVTPDAIAEKHGRAIKSEISELTARIDEMEKKVANARKQIQLLEDIQELEEQMENVKQYVAEQQQTALAYKSEIDSAKAEAKAAEGTLHEYHSKGAFGKMFSSNNPEKIEARKSELLRLIYKREEQVDEIRKELREAKSVNDKLKEGYKLKKAVMPKQRMEYYQVAESSGADEIAELNGKKNTLERELEELLEKLLLEAKVVATTLTKSYTSKVILAREYDCVIIDEASMAPLPAVLCAVGLAQQNAVLVGDFLQLPPVAKHKVIRTKNKSFEEVEREQKLVQDWLMRDIFAVSGVEQGIRDPDLKRPHKVRQLKKQYRMEKSIAELVNKLAYGKFGAEYALETDTATTDNLMPEQFDKEPAKGAHIAFYDTSNRGAYASQLDGGSYYNLYNALVCIQIAKQALQAGYKSVGIISAYRAQANLLQKMVSDTFKGKEVDADTVHRFQGGEKELIIFDVTTPSAPSMYDDGHEEGDDMKIMNVAISRARDKAIIVGDVKQIQKNHSSSSLVRMIIDHVNEHHLPVYDTEKVLDGYVASEETDRWLSKLSTKGDLQSEMAQSGLFDERNFYSQFIDDLLNAKREVIIDSPYMTTRRVDILYPYFEQLRRKGVEIYILTRVPKEQDGKMQYYSEVEINRLSDLGIKVLPFIGKIHRKNAIIDRTILWEGSLNILSQNDSRESMRRFEGPSSSQQMMAFLKLDKNIGPIGSDTLRHCEFCDSPVAWYWTDKSVYGGTWTFCLLNRHKEGVPPKNKNQIAQAKKRLKEARGAKKEYTEDGLPICAPNSVHRESLVMVKRQNFRGQFFYGCSKYPACKVTEKIR